MFRPRSGAFRSSRAVPPIRTRSRPPRSPTRGDDPPPGEGADRRAGILLHVSSLPSRFGAGDLGPAAVRFLDWAAAAGQTLWQVLPLGPAGAGDSPYGGASAFAGNPLFISPERMLEEGWVSEGEAFDTAHQDKEGILRRAFDRFRAGGFSEPRRDFELFRSSPDQASWLADWSLYEALRRRAKGAGWITWDAPLARREPRALDAARRELGLRDRIRRVDASSSSSASGRACARRRSAAESVLVGDLPIYVAHDSADVWAHRDLFALDDRGLPERVAGVPARLLLRDGPAAGATRSTAGTRMRRDGFAWWTDRLRANLRSPTPSASITSAASPLSGRFPRRSRTALNGRWVAGPGRGALRRRRASARRRCPSIAEDLGVITPDVDALREELGFPA